MLESEYISLTSSAPKFLEQAYKTAQLCEFDKRVTKVGCVISLKDITYSASNGPIHGKPDLKILDKVPHRDHLTLHAETAAIVKIYKENPDLLNKVSGGTLYLTHKPRTDEVKMAVALDVRRVVHLDDEDVLYASSLKLRKPGESGSEKAEKDAMELLRRYITIEKPQTEFDLSVIKNTIENTKLIRDCEFKSCAIFVDSKNKVTGIFKSQYMYGLDNEIVSKQTDITREKMIVRPAMLAMMDPLKSSGIINDATLYTTVASCTSCLAPIYSAGFKRIIFDKLFTDGSCMKKTGSNEALPILSNAIDVYGIEYKNINGKRYSEYMKVNYCSSL